MLAYQIKSQHDWNVTKCECLQNVKDFEAAKTRVSSSSRQLVVFTQLWLISYFARLLQCRSVLFWVSMTSCNDLCNPDADRDDICHWSVEPAFLPPDFPQRGVSRETDVSIDPLCLFRAPVHGLLYKTLPCSVSILPRKGDEEEYLVLFPRRKQSVAFRPFFQDAHSIVVFFFHTTLDLEYLPSVWKLRRRSSTGSVGWWRGISLLFGRLPFLASVSALFLQDIKQIQIISAKKTDAFFSPLLLYNRKMHLVVPWIMRGNM